MTTQTHPPARTDALAASIAVAALAALWLYLKLYWQGGLLLVAAVGLYVFAVHRRGSQDPKDPAPTAAPDSRKASQRRRGKKGRAKR